MAITFSAARNLGHPRVALIWTAGFVPVLAFPPTGSPWMPLVWVAAALPVLAAVITRQRWWPSSPFIWPLAVLGCCVGMGMAVSPSPELSIPKFSSVLLGILLLRALLLSISDLRELRLALTAYLAAGAGVSVIGLVSSALNTKFLPPAIVAHIPRLILSLPGAHGAVNPNAVGGTTLYFCPLAIVLLAGLRRGHAGKESPRAGDAFTADRDGSTTVTKGILILLVLIFGASLLLTQSRTSFVALAGALGVGALSVGARSLNAARRRILVAGAVGTCVIVSGFALLRPATLAPVLLSLGITIDVDLLRRVEIWDRALQAVRDFPITGVGLGAFRQVMPQAYPLSGVLPAVEVPHAHNVFLQTALDTGVPGLIAYLALLLVAAAACASVCLTGRPEEQLIALGLGLSLLAVHVFGLTDAIALGAKVGIFFWWNLALLGGLLRIVRSSQKVGGS